LYGSSLPPVFSRWEGVHVIFTVPHIHIMHSGGNSQGVEIGYNQENIIAIILFLEQLINKR
jgi:hypothetical protein